MVERSRFDLALVEAAARAGVEVRDDEPVRAISESDSEIVLRTRLGRFEADAVVVADGEPSRAARQLGLGGPAKRLALALEVDGIARAAEFSITAALIAVRFSGIVRERALDAIAGRREPFRIDGRCSLACACETHTSAPAPSFPPGPVSTASPHCPRCSMGCAA